MYPALYEHKALKWWHRVAALPSGDYYLRGWKQERIWPDFVAMAELLKKQHQVNVMLLAALDELKESKT